MKVLGVNAIYHDPSAALVVDGEIVAAAEEERFSRRKHGKRPVPFSAWELPELSMRWCLAEAGLTAGELDAVGYSFDPSLSLPADELGLHDPWDWLRVDYARRAPQFVAGALPGLDPERVHFVRHHVAHAASAGLAAPHRSSACLVLDGRGERASHLAGRYGEDGSLEVLATQDLPHSLGLLYEELTQHLGFLRSSDEYKVMALASYGTPRHLADFEHLVRATGDGGFVTEPVDWTSYAPAVPPGSEPGRPHADLAASVQRRLEQVLVDLAGWTYERTGERVLTMAGGTALNCVANSVILRETPFDEVWVQPAAGDAGTSLGAALHLSVGLAAAGDGGVAERPAPMTTAALGRQWSDDDLASVLRTARLPFRTLSSTPQLAAAVADVLAADGVVAWFAGRSEFGPRALGHRSLLAHPGHQHNLERMNDVKGREQFRPIAPLVLLDRAKEIFDGPVPSPYMLFVHDVAPEWRARIPAVVHVDGTARVQTVDPALEPVVAALLAAFEQRSGLPVLINTSLNTAGRPMVDSPQDALELFGAAPVDLLVLGPHVVFRAEAFPA